MGSPYYKKDDYVAKGWFIIFCVCSLLYITKFEVYAQEEEIFKTNDISIYHDKEVFTGRIKFTDRTRKRTLEILLSDTREPFAFLEVFLITERPYISTNQTFTINFFPKEFIPQFAIPNCKRISKENKECYYNKLPLYTLNKFITWSRIVESNSVFIEIDDLLYPQDIDYIWDIGDILDNILDYY